MAQAKPSSHNNSTSQASRRNGERTDQDGSGDFVVRTKAVVRATMKNVPSRGVGGCAGFTIMTTKPRSQTSPSHKKGPFNNNNNSSSSSSRSSSSSSSSSSRSSSNLGKILSFVCWLLIVCAVLSQIGLIVSRVCSAPSTTITITGQGSLLFGGTANHPDSKVFSNENRNSGGSSRDATTSTFSSQPDNHRDQLPQQSRPQRPSPLLLFMIHIGPPKTGTTTIQARLRWLEPELQHDGYTFQGRNNAVEEFPPITAGLRSPCQQQVAVYLLRKSSQHPLTVDATTTPMPLCWRNFAQQMEQYYQNGQHVIISDEHFGSRWTKLASGQVAPFDLDLLEQTLQSSSLSSLSLSSPQQQKWNIVIVATYRRFWEWSVSNKHQLELDHAWRRETCQLTFDEWIQPLLTRSGRNNINYLTSKYYYQYLDLAVKPFQQKRHGYRIHIMNMHNSPQAVDVDFVCNILPNATHACAKLTQTPVAVVNQAPKINYNMLACTASREHRLFPFPGPKGNPNLVAALQAHHETKLHSKPLPLICPSNDTLRQLWNESVHFEQLLVPEFFAATDQREAEQSFWQAAANHFFCSFNTSAIWSDPEWLEFFHPKKKTF